jgi:putative ABC transport system substrate-binding protein
MSLWLPGMLGLALLAMATISHASAQTAPVIGYIDGKNLRIEYREAVLDGEYDAVMAELVGRKPDMVLAANVAATVAASKATSTIPIVMLAVFDPIGIGVVKTLERPGTNVTGTTTYAPQLVGERRGYSNALCPISTKSRWS